MAETIVIQNETELDLAEARIDQLTNNWKNDDELAELNVLAAAVDSYTRLEVEQLLSDLDGVDRITGFLDGGGAALGDMIAVFGGRERFVEYMTRERNLDAIEIDALVAAFDLRREDLDRPFTEPPGWGGMLMDGGEACGDVGCCGPGEVDWRGEVLGWVGADGVREGELVG